MATVVWHDGHWYDEQPMILGPLDHAFWMASVAFDGARAFDGFAPDLDLHCARLIQSAERMLLAPPLSAERVLELCIEAVHRLPSGAASYIRPAVYATRGFVSPEAESARFVLAAYEAPLPEPKGMSICFSPFKRPARDAAPTDAKAGCLYPNLQRALADAARRGFDNAVTFDPNGNVAELCTSNIWIVRDGVALTPAANGTFLAGITRNRVLKLLNEIGIEAREAVLTRADLLAADEVFTSGNYGKVLPITRLEERDLQPGPVYRRARDAYFEFARAHPV